MGAAVSVMGAISGFVNRSEAIRAVRRVTVGGIGTPWRGQVTRVSAGGTVYVTIPLYAKGHEFACEDYSGAGETVVTVDGGNVRPIAAGDMVVVEFWGSDDPVIVSRRV